MSTGLTLEAIKARTDALIEDIRAQDPNLTLIYAVHHHGHLQSTLHVMEDLILQHPAGPIARLIINRKHPPMEPSAFLGIAAAQSRSWLGLQNSTAMLALISLNIDQYDGFDAAQYDMYHLAWQALEMAELCRRPEMIERLQSRPMVPKRGPMGEAKSNLRGDIFTAMMLATDGYSDAVEQLARHRATQVLERAPQAKPENFPFILAAEATDYGSREVYPTLDPERSRIARCRDVTMEISDATTDDQIRQWWRFCEPAQDMAWRGYDPSIILGAALHTCEDPYVRAIAHQMISITGFNPSHLEKLKGEYNPFMNLKLNTETHMTLIEETFQVVLAQGVDEDSGKPFLALANNQNRDLVHGRFLGWCATALQSAGKAFERARALGKSPEQAAKLEFEIYRDGPPLEGLQTLCKDIINKRREGEIVTLEQLTTLARGIPELVAVVESVEQTLADPNYQNTLEAVQELTRNLEPTGPAAQLAAQLAPAPPAPRATPQVLEFTPGGLSLPPMTTRNMPGQQSATPAPPPPPKQNTSRQPLPDINAAGLSLELAFAEADEEPPKETTDK